LIQLNKFRCAVIGCGRIGCGFDDNPKLKIKRTHASAYYDNPQSNLIAFCDIDKKKLKKYGKKYRVKGLYTNSKTMLENEKLDCISICTLVESHFDLIIEAAKYGVKGIFVEKPISDSLTNVKKIIEICNKNKIALAVDHQRRFEPFYQDIKKFIQKQKLGDIKHVKVYYGAGIVNTGSHVFDLLRFFFGEVNSVLAKKSKFKSPNSSDPNLDVFLEFKKGNTASIIALDLSNYGICEFEIFGTKGRVDIDLLSNSAKLLRSQSKTHDYKKLVQEKFVVDKSKKSGTILGIQNLIDSIDSNETPLCSGFDGYKSLELVIASHLSSSKNKSINLPLKNNSYKIRSK